MSNNSALKIFIVDDNKLSRLIYDQHLRNLGYSDIGLFENGRTCLAALDQQPNIIFLDYNMEDLNGIEVLRQIKQFNHGIYVVIVSGQDDIKTAVATLKEGAFDYIVKWNKVNDNIEKVINQINEVQALALMNNRSNVF